MFLIKIKRLVVATALLPVALCCIFNGDSGPPSTAALRKKGQGLMNDLWRETKGLQNTLQSINNLQGHADERLNELFEEKRARMADLCDQLHTGLQNSQALQRQLGEKMTNNLFELTQATTRFQSISEAMQINFDALAENISTMQVKLDANTKIMHEYFDGFGYFVAGQTQEIAELEGYTKDIEVKMQTIEKVQTEETDQLLNMAETNLDDISKTLSFAVEKRMVHLNQSLEIALSEIALSISNVKELHGQMEHRLGQISSNSQRLILTTAYHEIMKRFRVISRRRPEIICQCTLDATDLSDAANDCQRLGYARPGSELFDQKQRWIRSVEEGDQYGPSMFEVLFNIKKMIYGDDTVFGAPSIMEWFAEATRNALARDEVSASEKWLVAAEVKRLKLVVATGYNFLIEAMYCKEKNTDRADEIHEQRDKDLAELSKFLGSYVDSATPRMRRSADNYISPQGSVLDMNIRPLDAAESPDVLLGCRLCQGCYSMIDEATLAMQCRFREKVYGNMSSRTKIEKKSMTVLSAKTRTFPLSRGSEVNNVARNSGRLAKSSNGRLVFLGARYTVADPKRMLICGLKLRVVPIPGNSQQRAVTLGLDVCDMESRVVLTSYDGEWTNDAKNEVSRHIKLERCPNSAAFQGIPTVEEADVVASDWNALDIPDGNRNVGRIVGAGFCGHDIQKKTTTLRILKLDFDLLLD